MQKKNYNEMHCAQRNSFHPSMNAGTGKVQKKKKYTSLIFFVQVRFEVIFAENFDFINILSILVRHSLQTYCRH